MNLVSLFSLISEGPIEDNGLRLRFKEDSKDFVLELVGRLGVYGRITTYLDEYNKLYRVYYSEINSHLRGKGIGKQMYEALAKKLKAMGYGLASDTNRSNKAEGLWKSFEKRKMAKYIPLKNNAGYYVMKL